MSICILLIKCLTFFFIYNFQWSRSCGDHSVSVSRSPQKPKIAVKVLIALAKVFAFPTATWRSMNVSAAAVLLDHTARRLMPAHPAHVQIMAYALICLKVMRAIPINVCVRMVSSWNLLNII